jgi:hypothetical protein
MSRCMYIVISRNFFSKNYEPRKVKTTYNLKWMEYLGPKTEVD